MKRKLAYFFGPLLSLTALGILGCTNPYPAVVATLNQSAALSGNLPSNPLQGKVITSWIDRQHSLMATLYGNDLAVQYARTSALHDYPAGSVLSLVTWKQQDDPRWFGARIPATVESVEYVTVKTGANHGPLYSYQAYTGNPLKETLQEQGATPSSRAEYLLSQRAAVMP